VGEFAEALKATGSAKAGSRAVADELALPADTAVSALRARSSATAKGDAGVGLYNGAANIGRMQDRANSNIAAKKEARRIIAEENASASAKEEARAELKEIEKVEEVNEAALTDLKAQVKNQRFVAGFGNNGGEEFLSYMNISETFLAKGGKDWEDWSQNTAAMIHKTQNEDGSWSGHHCITGRTFCTSAALLTLMADRAPVPVADEVSSKDTRTEKDVKVEVKK
jgi:hypothetical protein